MEEKRSHESFLPPIHTNTFGIPDKKNIMAAYYAYKPSKETRALLSEAGRTIFAEEFIEDPKLGPLSDLAVRSLAIGFGTIHIAPLVASDPLKLRVHYDSLDVNIPLAECYFVNDALFWRRVVLAKHKNKALAWIKHDYPWKNLGVSLKYVELVEACPAEYWPEEEMRDLAMKVREFVTEMDIKKLQSLPDSAFEEYYLSESSLGSTTSSESSEFVTPTMSVTESVQYDENGDPLPPREKTLAELEEEAIEAEHRAMRIKEMREQKAARRTRKEDRRRRREAKRVPTPPPAEPVKGKRRRAKRVKGVFEIEVEPDEEDPDIHVNDRRNLDKYLDRKRSYKYPAEHCHHIDLSFVGYFIYMKSFTLEFQGPDVQRDYHTRHFNFSYLDTQRLVKGLSLLIRLQTFRLINSRMDARKLDMLLQALETLPELEELDFSNDQLKDDCGYSLYHFFKQSSSLKRLELGRNRLGSKALIKLAKGLSAFEGSLEYLGLAGNHLEDEGFHTLIGTLINTEQVKSLNIRSAFISQEALICCICHELLREHEILRELDMMAVCVGATAAKQLIIAVNLNKKILKLDCQACGLDLDIEKDLAVLLRRNEYIFENPYIGDKSRTMEEIQTFIERIKNPILLKALARTKKRKECMAKLPPNTDFVNSELDLRIAKDDKKTQEKETDRRDSQRLSDASKEEEKQASEEEDRLSINSDMIGPGPVEKGPFQYNPNEFTLQQFWKHLWIAGPPQRFFYFQAKNERGTALDFSK